MAEPKLQTNDSRYYAILVTEYAPASTFHLEARTEKDARKEAARFLAHVRVGQGHIEVYQETGGPKGMPLLVWVGAA